MVRGTWGTLVEVSGRVFRRRKLFHAVRASRRLRTSLVLGR
jgi:hypothetical protein